MRKTKEPTTLPTHSTSTRSTTTGLRRVPMNKTTTTTTMKRKKERRVRRVWRWRWRRKGRERDEDVWSVKERT